MAQVENRITPKKLAAGAGALIAAAFLVNLMLTPVGPTELDASLMQSITTEGTFKTVQGDGSQAIHVFLSTDCKYCHMIEPELGGLENVTVYRHILPGRSDAGRRAALDVWCSDTPAIAWKNFAAGSPTVSKTCDGAVLEKNLALVQRLGLTTTPAIVYPNGHVSSGLLVTAEIAERIAAASTL